MGIDEMGLTDLFLRLGISLGLGLLVGLQRERTHSRLAGFRTFALVTVFGTVVGLLAREHGGWLIAAGLFALALLTTAGYVAQARAARAAGKDEHPGQTTEVAVLFMFAVGALLAVGSKEVAIVCGAGAAVLLHWKQELHGFAGRIDDDDFRAIMRFALISLIILPVLPDRSFGPYEVLNPRHIWWIVVLIVGIGLAGYVAYKLVGAVAGSALAGLLGGLISSTATTVTYARRRGGDRPGVLDATTLVILLASSVVAVRILVEVAAVAPGFLPAVAGPIVLFHLLFLVPVALVLMAGARQREEMAPQANPSELQPALLFAALYAVVLVAVAAARERLGASGLYAVAALSGLPNVDAMTLSTARMVQEGRIAAEQGWRLIVTATLANLVAKAGIVALWGGRRLLARVGAGFLWVGLGGLAILALWP